MATVRAMPVLEGADVPGASAFYERRGFATHGYGDPPCFCVMQSGVETIAAAAEGLGLGAQRGRG